MQQRAKLKELFPNIEDCTRFIWESEIVSVEQGDAEDELSLELNCGRIIPDIELQEARDSIREAYGLRDVSIHIRYALEETGEEAAEYLRHFFACKYPSLAALMSGAELKFDRAALHIGLDEPWKLVRMEQLAENMARDIREELGMHLRVDPCLSGGL